MAQFQFNAGQYEPSAGLPLWPDGWHPVIVTSAEPQKNASGNSGRLEIQIEAIDGPMKGQRQRFGLNLWHESAQTVEIANRALSALIYVTLGVNQGRLTINQDTNEICNIPFLIQASRQKDNQNMNDFRAFKDIRGGDPKTGNGAGTVQIAPTAPGPGGFAPQGQQQPAFQSPPQNGGPAPVQTGGWAPPNGQQQPAQQQQPAFQAPPQQQQAPPPAGGGWAPPPAGGGAPQQQQPAFQAPQQQPQQFAAPQQQGGWAPPNGQQSGGPAPAPSWSPPR